MYWRHSSAAASNFAAMSTYWSSRRRFSWKRAACASDSSRPRRAVSAASSPRRSVVRAASARHRLRHASTSDEREWPVRVAERARACELAGVQRRAEVVVDVVPQRVRRARERGARGRRGEVRCCGVRPYAERCGEPGARAEVRVGVRARPGV
jgi:hypothetical protein